MKIPQLCMGAAITRDTKCDQNIDHMITLLGYGTVLLSFVESFITHLFQKLFRSPLYIIYNTNTLIKYCITHILLYIEVFTTHSQIKPVIMSLCQRLLTICQIF